MKARPWAYPVEFRRRAVAACRQGEQSVEEIAKLFQVGRRTLYSWLERVEAGDALEPGAHRSGNPARVDASTADVVRQIVAEAPDATAEEIAVYFVERTGRRCSRSAMVRALLRLKLTRKKRR